MAVNGDESKLFLKALRMAGFVVVFNFFEGLVSVLMGVKDSSLTLFGFGVDSFLEVVSNIGIIVMIRRIHSNPQSDRGSFERTALQITGYAFYILAVGLGVGAINNLLQHHTPHSTISGIIISIISIGAMYYVGTSQIRTGKKLNSAPIIADGKSSMICIYMSLVLLFASLIFELTGFRYMDVLGSAGLIYYSIREGKEALEEAREIK